MNIRSIRTAGLLAGLLSAASAFAAVDTASVTTAITDAGAALAVVGAALVAMKYGARVWKWIGSFGG